MTLMVRNVRALPLFLCFYGVILSALPLESGAQPSTAPPSSLPTTPLSPGMGSSVPQGCDLCWKPERHAGSDLRPSRRRRNPELQPKKNAKGVHGSVKGAAKSTLPRHPIAPAEERDTDSQHDASSR